MGGGLRYDRILAGTALALVLAVPLGAYGQTPAGTVANAAAQDRVKPPAPAEDIAKPAAPRLRPGYRNPARLTAATRPPATAAPATPRPAAAVNTGRAACGGRSAGIARSRRPGGRRKDARPARRQDRQDFRQQERARGGRDVLSEPQSRPLWLDKGVENARAKAVIARLKAADGDGLDLKDYKIPNLAASGPDALAEAELKLTQTVLTYARHVQAGRFPYTRISHNNVELPQAPPDAAAVLTKIADAKDAGGARRVQPAAHGYQALKKALAELRGKTGSGGIQIADGPVLKVVSKKPPMEDARVPMLRERLGIAGDAADLKYDAKLAEAVKKFQKSADLPATGNSTARPSRSSTARRTASRSTSSSPTWSAGAGTRAISARPIRWSTSPTSR